MGIRIELRDAAGAVLFSQEGMRNAALVFDRAYQPGDCVCIACDAESFLNIRVDAAVPGAQVYLAEGRFVYPIPFGEARSAYAPTAFCGERHMVSADVALPFELEAYRDLARNPLDLHDCAGVYPHVHANAETRGESVFAARNVIDGCRASHGHGEWPYLSWGVDIAVDAKITLDFGRTVEVDRMGVCIRADFPHDSWWTQATLVLSDGTSQLFPLEKTDALQLIDIGRHSIRWVRIENWVKYDEPAQFPALISWEVYGRG